MLCSTLMLHNALSHRGCGGGGVAVTRNARRQSIAVTIFIMTTHVLFICLGNICRSPLAEGVLSHLVEQRGVADSFAIDSAGTSGYHDGDLADGRMRAVAERHGVALTSRSRRVTADDFERFDHLLCMDDANHEALLAMGAPSEKVRLLLSVVANEGRREVPDPYYGGHDGFEVVFRLVHGACAALLDELIAERAGRAS